MSTATTAPDAPRRARRAPQKKRSITIPPRLRADGGEQPLNKHWRTYFLAHLIETSNVTAAARAAGIAPSRAYRVRQEDPNFAAQWRVALAQGYENLEMELLGYLRDPATDRKLDVANGLRLLAQHRQFVAHQRALADNRDEQDVLDSIDAMIDEMRERSAANAALLAEARPPRDREDDLGKQ